MRTKSFIASLLLMPVLMGTSGGVQLLIKRQSAAEDKRFAVIDRTPGGRIFPLLEKAAAEHNEKTVDPETGVKTHARFLLENIPPSDADPSAVNVQRLELSNRVRAGEFWGFVEIGPDVLKKFSLFSWTKGTKPDTPEGGRYLRYQTNHPTYEQFPAWAQTQIFLAIMSLQSGIPARSLQTDKIPLLTREGLSQRDPITGRIVDPPLIHQVARFIIPGALAGLMLMVIMLSATPSMHGVVEEKMQRIAEVLLGSLPPFQLMMGKLIGLMGVSLTIAAVYLGGAYWAASYYGFTEFLPVPLLAWFVLFQVLAVLMYGSLFLAIGAAATDIKETQTLVMPVVLLACIPMFILSVAMEDPNRPLVVGTSFFPPVTPMLMMVRLAIPPGPPLWQPLLAVGLALAVTLACVYAAGRIFRVGILMQGKGARLAQLLQWIIRG